MMITPVEANESGPAAAVARVCMYIEVAIGTYAHMMMSAMWLQVVHGGLTAEALALTARARTADVKLKDHGLTHLHSTHRHVFPCRLCAECAALCTSSARNTTT